ncbi:transforming acidic coiled-coil-containing protein 3 isoform X2 [Rhinichthys klamathensis goyatoka]|uniref:transforming acidic coiled-coil-containing protein 3 isoform X2 n=1 Tax=Rhinichthys klamathensis goyatoka TaxID=3034132 RepID=UPI0024B5EABF|nr:transforming acidic coiled-coil-containing protein 3 isoform X2 [Rhinichthys klamathensis goyatoka]
MSSEALKENQGAVWMNGCSEDACDIFALEQPTGRPSILRQSQADNISRTAQRGAKVCFQTPRRDPVTKKIMSPSRTSRPAIQEDNTKALKTHSASTDQSSLLNNTTTTTPIKMQSNYVAYPDDVIPVQSKGAYTLNLDNPDAINPFQGSNKMANSPPKSSALGHYEAWISELVESDTTAALVPEVTNSALDETLPFISSVDNSLAECSANISSAEGTVIIKTDNVENSITETEETEPAPASQPIPTMEDQLEAQDLPLPPAGSYNLDFDNLDLLNPFQTGGSKIPNSPLIGKASVVSDPPLPIQEAKQESEISIQTPDVPPLPSQEAKLESELSVHSPDLPSQGAKQESELSVHSPDVPSQEAKQESELSVHSPDVPSQETKQESELSVHSPDVPSQETKQESELSVHSPDIPSQETKQESELSVHSPDVPSQETKQESELSVHSPDVPSQETKQESELSVHSPDIPSQETKQESELSVHSPDVPSQETKQESELPVHSPDVPSQEAKLESELLVQTPVVPTSSNASMPPKENQMLLEFNFDDGAEVKRKPPKRFGVKRPAGAKTVTKKTVTEKKEPEPKKLSPKKPEETKPVDVPSVQGSYTFDFDDPNFNPFGTKAAMGSSPPRGVRTSPVLMKAQSPLQQPEAPTQDDQPENRSHQAVSESNRNMAETDLSVTKQEPEIMATPESLLDFQNQTCDLGVMAPSEEEFVPGALFMPDEDFDGQMDYLEQFGSSTFKESALRKQSLYLKFDPLLKESPKKILVDGGNSGFSLPRPSLAIRMMEAAKSEVKQKSHYDSMKLLDDLPPPAVETVVPDPTVLDLLVHTLKQPVKTEDSIIEVLKYSQRDMDAILQQANRKAAEREKEMQTQIDTLCLENQHMLFIVSEFEATITQITDEHKQKEDFAKIELERVLQEKDQLSKDLNEMEQSFSSVVKRLDRCKEVIEGFRKNEETLKQYAQNCMDRLQKEEKRYQALKAHAEEKLDQANKAISEVRTKQGAEVATLQVQFKRDQLKIQSLERDLEQKAKEVKDVSDLCDELLLKLQKHGF